MKSILLFSALLFSLVVPMHSQNEPDQKRLVPDSETAVTIAKAILKPIYGTDFIVKKNFVANERDGVWVVIGKPKLPPGKISTGGTVEVRISSADARVSFVHLNL